MLYALGGFSGSLTTYVKEGVLGYEYNLFEINRTKIRAQEKLPVGKVKIDVESTLTANLGGVMNVALKVNGKTVAQGQVPRACIFQIKLIA